MGAGWGFGVPEGELMKAKVIAASMIALGMLFWLGSEAGRPVYAQSLGIENEAFCDPRVGGDPNSEECVCSEVRSFLLEPAKIDGATGEALDGDGDGKPPVYEDGYWVDGSGEEVTYVDAGGDLARFVDGTPVPPSEDLVIVLNPYYDFDCTLSYLREDMRRAWQYAAVLAGTFLFVSLAWAGVMYMQDSASGADLSRSRTMMFRVVVGFIIVACAWILWEIVGDILLSHLQSWTGDRDVFYRPSRGG